jgi:glyoxylase-like metal-dependent hydrolase (beta-lactamase superfamily II)
MDAGADASAAATLTVQTYTSSTQGPIDLGVNSHLVLGPTEAIVVDAQLLLADAQAVVQKIKASGKTLKAVFITHAHPDHCFGLQAFTDAFPGVQIVTTQGVLDEFNQTAPPKFQFFKPQLGPLLADHLVTPTVLPGTTLTIDGVSLRVIELQNAGESAHGAALVLPGNGLITGDLVYHDVHLYLGECHASGWKQNLTAIGAMGFSSFYPGHGTSPVTAAELMATSDYIDKALPILEAAKSVDAGTSDAGDPRVPIAVHDIQAAFPTYASNFLLGFSTQTFLDTSMCP